MVKKKTIFWMILFLVATPLVANIHDKASFSRDDVMKVLLDIKISIEHGSTFGIKEGIGHLKKMHAESQIFNDGLLCDLNLNSTGLLGFMANKYYELVEQEADSKIFDLWIKNFEFFYKELEQSDIVVSQKAYLALQAIKDALFNILHYGVDRANRHYLEKFKQKLEDLTYKDFFMSYQ